MAETIYLEPGGGIVTFMSESEPAPAKLTVNTGGEDWFTVESPSDDVVQLIFPRTHRHRTVDITVTSQTPSDPEYESTATATSAYTIDQAMLEIAKTPKIESLEYRVVEESKATDIKPEPQIAEANDIVMCKLNTNELEIVKNSEWSLAKYPKAEWMPIGIVVIPASHGVLKDGTGTVNQCGVMSLVGMDCENPENGTEKSSVYYNVELGPYGTISRNDGLGRYDSVSNGLAEYNRVMGVSGTTGLYKFNDTYLPMQASAGSAPTYFSTSRAKGQSPYSGNDMKSGGYNTWYGSTSYDTTSTKNALGDFRGIVNTKILTDLSTSINWRTLTSFYDYRYSDGGSYIAACLCARFKTVGTKAFKDCSTAELKNGTGFWYLPSAGELAYFLPRARDINNTISRLRSAYGVGTEVSGWNGTSTKYGGSCFVSVCEYLGELHNLTRGKARAFMRL